MNGKVEYHPHCKESKLSQLSIRLEFLYRKGCPNQLERYRKNPNDSSLWSEVDKIIEDWILSKCPVSTFSENKLAERILDICENSGTEPFIYWNNTTEDVTILPPEPATEISDTETKILLEFKLALKDYKVISETNFNVKPMTVRGYIGDDFNLYFKYNIIELTAEYKMFKFQRLYFFDDNLD